MFYAWRLILPWQSLAIFNTINHYCWLPGGWISDYCQKHITQGREGEKNKSLSPSWFFRAGDGRRIHGPLLAAICEVRDSWLPWVGTLPLCGWAAARPHASGPHFSTSEQLSRLRTAASA